MRTFSPATLAALQSGSVALVQLLKLAFSGTPIYLNSSTWDLVWQRRYNLLTYSESFANTAWQKFGATVAASSEVAPYGRNAEKLVQDTATSGHSVYRTNTVTASAFYEYSVYVKAAEISYVCVWCDAMAGPYTSGGVMSATFNLSTASVHAVKGSSNPVIESLSGGWFRCSIRANTTGTTIRSGQSTDIAGNLTGYPTAVAGDGVSGFYFGGAQFELGETTSSYTPTTTTALTDLGTTYKGAFGLGQISAITDKPGEVQGITLELHGADAARISLALDDADVVQGTPVEVRTALIDTSTYQILDAPIEWVGTMDTMSIAEDGTSATIAVTCESKAVDLLRGNASMYSDADQRAINATDGAFSYVVDQIDKPIVWPSREFFYK